jgi:polyhydroxyalkanoate synthesis repressor PhaR
MAYVIKRYSNRKLYDLQQSHYVTLEALETLIAEGKEISVVDAATGDDLTAITLILILLERVRGHRHTLTPALFHQIIRHGESWQDLLQNSVRSSLVGIVSDQQEQDRIVKTWASQVGLTPSKESKEGVGDSQSPPRDARSLRQEAEALRERLRTLEERLKQLD